MILDERFVQVCLDEFMHSAACMHFAGMLGAAWYWYALCGALARSQDLRLVNNKQASKQVYGQ